MKDKLKEFLSFTAADSFPVKVAQDWDLIRMIVQNNYIPPSHIQLCPTNKCTRKCTFCSCSERDKKAELSLGEIANLIHTFYSLGCEGVTITGGGEPLCHPHINHIIEKFIEVDIAVGLVSNADLIEILDPSVGNEMTWCRVSCSDEMPFDLTWWGKLEGVAQKMDKVDWSLSYVVSSNPQPKNIALFAEAATKAGFRHMRVVSDLLDYENVPWLGDYGYDIILYQHRKKPKRGTKDCWISLLKPLIDASGDLFPCCGAQYAEKVPSRNFNGIMKMGDVKDAPEIWRDQKKFDGSVCYRCYYTDYNRFLNGLLTPLDHKEFK